MTNKLHFSFLNVSVRECLLSSFYFPKKRNSLNFRSFCVLNIGELTLFQRKILLTLFYPIPELLVLDYSLSVPYLDTKNVHIKVFILDIFKIGLHHLASSFEFAKIVFVSWNAGKVPDSSTSAKGTKERLTSR